MASAFWLIFCSNNPRWLKAPSKGMHSLNRLRSRQTVYYVLNTVILPTGCSAPVMVALALIELGLQYEDAVDMIRQ